MNLFLKVQLYMNYKKLLILQNKLDFQSLFALLIHWEEQAVELLTHIGRIDQS